MSAQRAVHANSSGNRLLVTYGEATTILGGEKNPVSIRHVERLVAARRLRSVGRGRARRIIYASILVYIEGDSNG